MVTQEWDLAVSSGQVSLERKKSDNHVYKESGMF